MSKINKTVLITGASQGIGHALAVQYAEAGARVIAVARTAPSQSQPGNIEWIKADLAEQQGIENVAMALEASGVSLDILINNAGIQQAIDLVDIAPEAFSTMALREIALNLSAPMLLSQRLIPLMVRPGGTVVNVTSLLSRHPKASAPVYSASKAGLASFTRSLRHQFAPLGIRVVEVLPPLVATAMTDGRGGAKLSPEEMARAIIRGVERGDAQIAPGMSRSFLAINRVLPELAASLMIRS